MSTSKRKRTQAPNLTEKQKRFCREYIVDLNGTQAAIRAGYSKKTAANIANEYLMKPHIAKEVERLQKKKQERTDINADMVIHELSKIAFSDVRELFTDKQTLKAITDLDDKSAAAIAMLDIDEIKADGRTIGLTKKIKLWDKLRALETLGRHFGVFEKDNAQKKAEVQINIDNTENDL